MEIELLKVNEPEIKKKITSASIIYDMMQEESKADRECMFVIHLNSQNEIIRKELISMGTINEAITAPREVFRRAIIEGAHKIIIVHNHPSGHTEPSTSDKRLENTIREAGKIIDIPLLDFIIIGNGYYSSKEASVI